MVRSTGKPSTRTECDGWPKRVRDCCEFPSIYYPAQICILCIRPSSRARGRRHFLGRLPIIMNNFFPTHESNHSPLVENLQPEIINMHALENHTRVFTRKSSRRRARGASLLVTKLHPQRLHLWTTVTELRPPRPRFHVLLLTSCFHWVAWSCLPPCCLPRLDL